MEKKRIDFIDLAKGFCIILVVWSHCLNFIGLATPLNLMLGAFRMPLYFFLSGLFFKQYEGFVGFLKRKINKLLIPFLFFYVIGAILLPNLLNLVGYTVRNCNTLGITSLYAFFSPTIRTFPNGPIWFLICLFWLNVLFYGIFLLSSQFKKNNVLILVLLSFVCGFVGWMLGQKSIQVLPMYIDTALTAMPFYCLGYICNKHTDILYPNKTDKYIICIIPFLIAFTYFFAVKTNFQENIFGNVFFMYSTGITGTLMVMLLAKLFHRLPLISYWGRYSIIILCTHQLVIQFVTLILRKIIVDVSPWSLLIMVFIITMGLCLLIIPFCIKYLPYVTAQKDVIKI